MSRRGFLRAAAGTAAVAGAVGSASAQAQPDFGGWLEDVDGGFTDARGEGEVTVAVGAEGNGGAFAFEPAGLWVDPGTTVVWEWTGEGGGHNVHAVDGGDFESDVVSEAGVHFEHTFEAGGIATYQCDPHESLGMKGAVAVGDDVPLAGGGGQSGGDGGGTAFPAPGGLLGFSFMFLFVAAAAFAVVAVSAGEYYRDVKSRGGSDHVSAQLTAALAIVLGLLVIAAIVAQLLLA